MEILFSYGTLQNAETQVRLFGHVIEGSKDLLKGFKKTKVEINDPVFLAHGEQKEQRLAVFTGKETDQLEGTALLMTNEELLRADAYEPAGYERVSVTLASGRKAWLYAAKPLV